MTGIAAEAAHEAGRQGAMRARHLLWQVLGSTIDLPFNAYDHGPKLTFSDNDPQPSQFSFDLRGILRRSDAGRFGGQEAVEVFVEVKAHSSGEGLLTEYRSFLKRAAVVTSLPAHADSWFIFLAGVPFGTTQGVALCNGSLIAECRQGWPAPLQQSSDHLHERLSLVIATQ